MWFFKTKEYSWQDENKQLIDSPCNQPIRGTLFDHNIHITVNIAQLKNRDHQESVSE